MAKKNNPKQELMCIPSNQGLGSIIPIKYIRNIDFNEKKLRIFIDLGSTNSPFLTYKTIKEFNTIREQMSHVLKNYYGAN